MASTSRTAARKVSTASTLPFSFTPKIRALSPESFTVHHRPSYLWLFARPEDSVTRSSRIVKSFFGGAGASAATAGETATGKAAPTRLSSVAAVAARALRNRIKAAPRGRGKGPGWPAAAGPATHGPARRTPPGRPDRQENPCGRRAGADCAACSDGPRTALPPPGNRPGAT